MSPKTCPEQSRITGWTRRSQRAVMQSLAFRGFTASFRCHLHLDYRRCRLVSLSIAFLLSSLVTNVDGWFPLSARLRLLKLGDERSKNQSRASVSTMILRRIGVTDFAAWQAPRRNFWVGHIPPNLLSFPSPLSFLTLPFPSPSLRLPPIRIKHLSIARGSLGAPPAGSGAQPQRKANLLHLALKSDMVAPIFTNFPEN